MVRYIAPQFDQTDDNDSQEEATPMDWEIISDNECNDNTTTSLVKHNNEQQDDEYESIEYHKAELLRIQEEEEYDQCRLEQYKKKKWKRIRTAITIAIAIIAIVLKRHAPPPPPIVYQSPFIDKGILPNYSTDNSAISSIDDGTTASYSNNDLLQHETWSQYTKHILNLLHRTLRYSISVTYYTISNSFLYTYNEVYDVYGDVLSNRSSSGVSLSSMKSAIKSWLEKLRSLDNDISSWFNEMIQRRKTSDSNTQEMNDIRNHEDEVVACPIKIPSSTKIDHQQQHNQINHNQVVPTEDRLRQTIGVSLSPQNMALQLIADRLDSWGKESLISQQHAPSVGQTKMEHNAKLTQLPPAMGFLIVGSEGVGKLHIARRLSYLLLGHCSSSSTSTVLPPSSVGDQDSPLTGVLQVNGGSFNYQSILELIIQHIHSRTNLGSVVIIQHVEEMDKRALFEVLEVLSGTSRKLSYKMSDGTVIETSCNGTVFIMTSRLWGIESIYQHLPSTAGRKGLQKESLLSSIRQEVTTMTSRFDSSIQLSRSMTIVPILPFQHEDLSSILQGRIQGINRMYQGNHWKNLVVSLAAIRYLVGIDHINFSDTYTSNNDYDGEEEEISMALSYSTNGAHSINNNILWQRLHTGITAVDRRRPESTLKVDIDEDSKELLYSWCKIENGLETCQVE